MLEYIFPIIILVLLVVTVIIIIFQLRVKDSLNNQIDILQTQNIKEKEILNNDRIQLQEREAKLNQMQDQNFQKQERLESELLEIEIMKKRLIDERQNNRDDYQQSMLKIINMSKDEVKELYFQMLDERHREERKRIIDKHIDEIEMTKRREGNKLLLKAMENISSEITSDSVVTSIELSNDDLKGRLIGREGRNIKTIENTLGINLIIDDTPGVISVSCFDPVRREVATRTLEKLLESGRINQATIEQEAKLNGELVDEMIFSFGNDALDQFAITDVNNDLVYILGALHFRSSFGQNVLAHCIEAAKIGISIANELKLDAKLAARCALLHDIGKYDKYETGKSHVQVGKLYAEQCGECHEVVNSIASHHEDEPADNVYSQITMIADRLSASRPGSRKFTGQNYMERITKLEEIANGVIGVSNSFALQGGRELRLIVEASAVADDDLPVLTDTIKRHIEEQLSFPGVIKINAIREVRYSQEAIKNNNI